MSTDALPIDPPAAPAKAAPRKRAGKTPDVPAATEQAMAAATEDAVRKRRTLRDLPDGWEYAVTIRNGEDTIVVGAQTVEVNLNGRQSSVAVADLSEGLDKARGILKTYAAYREQVLAFDALIGGEVTRGHADANSVTTAADVTQVVASEGAGVTVAESAIQQ